MIEDYKDRHFPFEGCQLQGYRGYLNKEGRKNKRSIFEQAGKTE